MYRIPGLNFDDHSNYDALMNDIIDKVVMFVKVFKKHVKQVDAMNIRELIENFMILVGT